MHNVTLGVFDPRRHSEMLVRWLSRSHVAKWWGDAARAMEHARQRAPESHALIVVDGAPVGYLCWQEPPKEELAAAGLTDLPGGLVDIDILIGEAELLGQGVGSRALEILLARLRSEQAVGFAGLGTSATNTNAIRCYTKAGFRLFRDFQDAEWGPCKYLIAEVRGATQQARSADGLAGGSSGRPSSDQASRPGSRPPSPQLMLDVRRQSSNLGINMKAPEDKDSVLARYKGGVALLERALSGLQDTDLDMSPSQGGWTIRQIVHHIVDGDDLWKVCIKIALGNEQAEFTLAWYWVFSQEEWADRWAYQVRSIDVSLELLKANRGHVLQLLERIPDAWNRAINFRTHGGEIERLPIGSIVGIQADHVEHHVKRILSIRRECEGA